ncbi:MAG: CARDB domain-containing protein, partial [Euryarchaeota archaeon]|nr:CARDB domain-containing protein [Euryarchaeota archaeon]
ATEATFVVNYNWKGELYGGKPVVTLLDPDGDSVKPTYVEDTHQLFRIALPKSGAWTVKLEQPVGVEFCCEGQYLIEVSVKSKATLEVFLGIPLEECVIGTYLPVVAFLTDTQPITGATISMEITTPELEHAVAILPSEVNTLSLYDDGEHGDSKADDGVYVGTFRNTDRAGVYRMKVKAEGYSSLVGSFERETKLAFNMRGDEDSDGDGLPDRWERNHGLDPHDGTGDQGAEGDPDRDGLTNKREYDVGTYPMDPDTDDGGENDGSEVVNGRDPHNPGDDTLRPPTSLRAIPGVNSVNLTIGYLHEHTFLIVSRAKSPDGPWESFRIYPTGGYEDGDLENDVTYYYRVVGANLQMHTTHVIYRVSAPTRIVSATPKADPIPPSGYVVINNGAELTETEDVTLMIWADPDTTEIMIANDPELADAEWEPYETAKNWTLLPGTGLRTVYVLFRDAAGNIGPRSPYDPSVDIHPAMDSIVLREIATTERRIYFSTEEDFVTQGPKPQDGNPIISDGDLLCSDGTIIARNRELLKAFETEFDLGLDASGVIAIDAKEPLVAFSTELNDPKWHFTAGDLLTTTGAVIPNIALLAMFDIPEIDLGLDAVHFTGDLDGIIKFLEYIADKDADVWREEPEMLSKVLEECDIDIWFSTEGTAPKPGDPLFLDGDLLSARYGTIVARNSELLPASVPAGIPDRGVDFGLDAATTDRTGNVELIKFSTEILYEGRFDFTDGDILRINNGVVFTNRDLIVGFEPKTGFLGLDAISIPFREGKPDLVMGEISLEDVDGHCRLSYQVSNAGTASAQASTTYLYLDGEKVAEDSTNSLAAGASAWDEFSYQITGEHTFEVCADGINEIEEISEANNCRTVELACQQPILAGNIIYHESHGAGIWRMNPDGSGNAQLSDHGWFAEYSPDNTKIVFGEYYHDGIWMMDADGTNQKQLTKSGSAPTWSPDGKKIAYHGGDTAGASRSIWVIAADGTNAHQLSDNPGSFPKWSPDAKRIAYHGEVNSGIWLINPGGTDETLLHRSGGYPAWSPDGKRIAYASLTDWCIWTIAANGTGATKLTDIKGVQPTWSPDGTKVAYEDLANNEGLRVVNSDGADDHLINKVGHAPDWSEGSSVLPAKPNLAYIYSTDAASAESYKSLLDVNEYPTTLIPMSDVADTDFSEYGAIIVGSDTSFGYEWGDSASVGTIKNSEKRIIGLGFGGSGLFQELGLSINWGHGWIGQEDSIYVVDPSHTIFNSPNPIVVPADGIVSLYSSSGHIGEYAPSLSADVVLLGREPGDADHYPIVQEEQNILWGFTASPDDMTQVGQDIFINVVDHMTSSTEFDIYFADADESPGSVYHYDIASGMEETVYTRPSKRLYSFAFHPKIPEKLYYVNANEYKIYRTHQISSGWAPEEVVYTHTTYIRDIAFAFDSNGELGLYFSEATGAGGDGKIYRIEDGYATPYYDVKLADVDRSWAGDFAFDAESNLYLSSGNRVPARIYRVDDGSVKEIYKDEKEPIKGLVCEDGVLYYANWRTKIYRLDTDTGERTVVYSNPERGWLSDVGFR